MINQAVNTPKLPDGSASFHPHARRVGDFIYVSGLISRNAVGSQIPGVELDTEGNILSYDIEEQTRATIENLKLILHEAGSSLDKVFDVTVFLTDVKKDFRKFNTVYGTFFAGIMPCRTTVEVSKLPSPVAIEIKCIATL